MKEINFNKQFSEITEALLDGKNVEGSGYTLYRSTSNYAVRYGGGSFDTPAKLVHFDASIEAICYILSRTHGVFNFVIC